ncbi:hypothetical protein EDD15DRAFT_2286047 [Pisolithus albus]|nr:hypothetical protein EDD15DRAFT_2286047 [Pisolithus albus]
MQPKVAQSTATPSCVSSPASSQTDDVASESQPTSSALLRCKNQLSTSGYYLADDDVINNVRWIKQGHCDFLAVNDSNNDTQREMAVLSAIVHISSNDYWLTSDGGYRKGSSITSRLCDVKPSCTVSEPSMPPVNDFANVIKNLRAIVMKCATPGYKQGKGFFFYDNSTTNPSRFKVRHKLFERLEHENAEKTVFESSNAPECYDFLPQNWYLTHEETREELYLLERTHKLRLLPAYDVNGHLIPPAAYQRSLENAVVELHFNLCHWPIASKAGAAAFDSYTADIVFIRVLVPPPPPINNDFQQKRKISFFVDPDAAVAPPRKKKK